MIGLLVTGHANFGSGITSSVNLIAGEQEDYRYVDFLPTYSLEDLSRELNKALDDLRTASTSWYLPIWSAVPRSAPQLRSAIRAATLR